MFKIGDFSKLGQVPVKTLRYYDELGLLTPVKVDSYTGYRFYAAEQLARLNRILALKDLGFSLEQIAQLLDEGLPPEQIRGMLRIKQMEIQQKLGDEQERLMRVEARLRQIEMENNMTPYDVVIKKVDAQQVASLRRTLKQPQETGMLIQELFVYLDKKGIKPGGPPCTIWHDAEYHENNIDTEVIVPVQDVFPEENGIHTVQVPAFENMACTIHHGPYEGFGEAYAALMGWVEQNGYRMAGPLREIYLRGPGPMPTNPAEYVTEIQIPVEKA